MQTLLGLSSDPGKVLSRGQVLNLTSVRHGDEGKYCCLVDNGVGGQIKSRIAILLYWK